MSVRLIPERTVDSMLAIEIVSALPQALIWSPTNTSGSHDHEVYAPLDKKPLIFECKGTFQNGRGAWRSPIDRNQLSTYAQFEPGIWYLFPTRPVLSEPWFRKPCSCNIGSATWDNCIACHNHGEPETARRNAGYDPLLRKLDLRLKIQPWFSHWCWVVPALALDLYLQPNQKTLFTDDTDFFNPELICSICGLQNCSASINYQPTHHALQHADRLCHLLARIRGTKPNVFEPISAGERMRGESVAELLSYATNFPRTSDREDQSGLTIAFVD